VSGRDSAAYAKARHIWKTLESGDIQQASLLCQQLHRSFPDYAEGWHVASHVAERARLPQKSYEFIQRALQLDESNTGYLLQYSSILHRIGRFAEGLQIAKKLAGSQQNSAAAYNVLGSTLARFDLHEDALRAIDNAIALDDGRANFHFNRAAELRFLGRLPEAEDACNRCIEIDPLHYEAYLLRSDLRVLDRADNHVEQLKRQIPLAADSWRGEVQLCFALAKELEDMKAYEESMKYRRRGADLRRKHMIYDSRNDLDAIESIIKVFDKTVFANNESTCSANSPIFIVGLPRTGTTLLERILGSHGQVHSAGELNNFAQALVRLVGQKFGTSKSREQFVQRSANVDFTDLGQEYIDSTASVSGDTSHFIDKLPLNFLYAGLIHIALPHARLIHMRRHPMAACYAIYKHLFQDAYPFSYSLTELGDYYVAYHRLMQHWRRMIPATAMIDVRYEDLVTNTESEARRVLEFCSLNWEERCLKFQGQKTASTTASAAQVRQPVHTRSVDQWRNYEEQLQPLKDILVRGGVKDLD
jgi:tetratricopeptide (TPR) repeat protein